MSLLARSLALVAVSLMPAIAIQATNELDARNARLQELRNVAGQRAELAAAELRHTIMGIHELLTTLTFVPSIREGRKDECNPILQRLASENGVYLNIAAADANGSVHCSALQP